MWLIDVVLRVFTILGMMVVFGSCLCALYAIFHKDEIFEIKEEEDDE